ncbi:hypothetical protein C8F01DRAFT_1179878 [Mycena amicta]|nr:hypothetical protein C8F01DRAFT_1179878 [Mycena amicta]
MGGCLSRRDSEDIRVLTSATPRVHFDAPGRHYPQPQNTSESQGRSTGESNLPLPDGASEAALSTIDSGEATSQYTSIEDEETNDALLSVLRSTSTVNADTTSPMPVLIEDISAWDKHLPSGGTLYSVHVPTRASEWLDTHAEYELLTQLHVHEAFGPFAYQLTPDEEGFVVFARLSSSGLRELVHELVNASGFPIIMRPYEEYPLAADIRPDNNLTQMERLRGGSDSSHSAARELFQKTAEWVKGKGKDGDDIFETEMAARPPSLDITHGPTGLEAGTWEPKQHIAMIEVALKDNNLPVKPIRLYAKFKFQRVDHQDVSRDCVACAEIKVHLDHNTYSLDQSYSNMGFVVHRPNSIRECTMFIPPELQNPQFTSKRTREQSQSTTGGGTLNIGAKLTGTLKLEHTRGSKYVEERTDQRPKAKVHVEKSPGAEWDKHATPPPTKDYQSWDLTWRPARDEFGKLHDAVFNFNLEMDLKRSSAPYKSSSIPNDIGSVLRNQVMIWSTDPGRKVNGLAEEEEQWAPREHPKLQGIMLVTSTYIPNVFTDNALEIDKTIGLDLTSNSNKVTRLVSPLGETQNTLNYVGVARLPSAAQTKHTRLQRLLRKLHLRKQADAGHIRELPVYDVVLPDEAEAQQWIGPLWPSMDQQFRKLESGAAARYGKVAWKRQMADVQQHRMHAEPPRWSNRQDAESSVATTSQSAYRSGRERTTTTDITTPADSASAVTK